LILWLAVAALLWTPFFGCCCGGGCTCTATPTYDDGTLWCTPCSCVPLKKLLTVTACGTTGTLTSSSRGSWGFSRTVTCSAGCLFTDPPYTGGTPCSVTLTFNFHCTGGSWFLSIQGSGSGTSGSVNQVCNRSASGYYVYVKTIAMTGDPTTRPTSSTGTLPTTLDYVGGGGATMNISALFNGTVTISE
jgi:hypothetical protein